MVFHVSKRTLLLSFLYADYPASNLRLHPTHWRGFRAFPPTLGFRPFPKDSLSVFPRSEL